jgi:thiamine biosynthesis lipoprotein ApbE
MWTPRHPPARMLRLLAIAAVALGLAACSTPAPQAARATWLAMGTRLDVRVARCKDPNRLTPDQIAKVIQAAEQRHSTWIPDSELSRLNTCRDVARVSSELLAELEQVLEISLRWKGAFHPGLGLWVLESGVRTGKLKPIPESLGRPPAFGRAQGTSGATALAAALKDRRWVFEEGGFAKGLALDLAAEKAEHHRCELELNFGGQVAHRGAEPIRVQIASPSKRDEPWVEITLQNASVATSGQSENPGHLLDPASGRPVPSNGSATAIHASALEADIASTAVAVLGAKADSASGLAQAIPPGIDWVYLHADGRAWAPLRLKARIQSLKPLKWQWVD